MAVTALGEKYGLHMRVEDRVPARDEAFIRA